MKTHTPLENLRSLSQKYEFRCFQQIRNTAPHLAATHNMTQKTKKIIYIFFCVQEEFILLRYKMFFSFLLTLLFCRQMPIYELGPPEHNLVPYLSLPLKKKSNNVSKTRLSICSVWSHVQISVQVCVNRVDDSRIFLEVLCCGNTD